MKITLITCTYNASQYIERTVESVLMQTHPDIEHLIIDGKSSDDTIAKAEAYRMESIRQQNGHEIIIRSEPDQGLYDAMNKGIAIATGEYLCFLNAGDTLPSPDTIANIVAKTKRATGTRITPRNGEGAFSVVYGETDVVDEQGNFLRHRRLQAPEKLNWRSFRDGMLVCHQAFYANTALAKLTPYDLRYRISGDVDWCIRIMKEGEKQELKTLNLHEVVSHYLAGGMSIKNHRASLIERFLTMCRHYGVINTIRQHLWFCIRAVVKK